MEEEVPLQRLLSLIDEMRLVSHRLLKTAMAGIDKTGEPIFGNVILYLNSLDPKVEVCINKLTKIIKSKQRYGSMEEEVTYNFMEFKQHCPQEILTPAGFRMYMKHKGLPGRSKRQTMHATTLELPALQDEKIEVVEKLHHSKSAVP